jgi:diacylglycerol kinase family enzyme
MIVNPASDSGRTAKAWPDIVKAAEVRGLECDVQLTARPGHATELARAALRADVDRGGWRRRHDLRGR